MHNCQTILCSEAAWLIGKAAVMKAMISRLQSWSKWAGGMSVLWGGRYFGKVA